MSASGSSNQGNRSESSEAAVPAGEHTAAGAGRAEVNAADESAATRFRKEVSGRRASLDDYDPEEELWSGGYSGKAMVGTWLLLTVVTVALIAAAVVIPDFSIWIALGISVVIWLIGGAIYAYRRLGMRYRLTTQRFIHQSGVVTRHTDRIEVIDIDDVSYSQGPVQRAFGVGKILITSSDTSHPELTMIGIHNVADVAGLIDDIRRKERRHRSLHIEQI